MGFVSNSNDQVNANGGQEQKGGSFMNNNTNKSYNKECFEARIIECRATLYNEYYIVDWVYEIQSGPKAKERISDASFIKTSEAKKYFVDACERLGEPYLKGENIVDKCQQLVGKRVNIDVVVRRSVYVNELILESTELSDEDVDALALSYDI